MENYTAWLMAHPPKFCPRCGRQNVESRRNAPGDDRVIWDCADCGISFLLNWHPKEED